MLGPGEKQSKKMQAKKRRQDACMYSSRKADHQAARSKREAAARSKKPEKRLRKSSKRQR